MTSLLGDARTGKLADNLSGFARALRRAGLPMDSQRIAMAQRCATLVGVHSKTDLKDALRSVLVSQATDAVIFDELFDAFFRNPDVAQQLLSQMLPKAAPAQPPQRRARVQEALTAPKPPAPAKGKEQEIDLDAAMTASQVQRLKNADFAGLSASEYRLIDRLVREIKLELPPVPSRRTRMGSRGDTPHWAAALRAARHTEGELMWLPRRQRQQAPLPLLVLVDVSGSMERYARLLLAFLHQATTHHRRDVFAFGTQLTPLNEAFALRDTDAMLTQVSRQIADFAGGTRMGDSLATLHRQHAKRLVGRRTVVLLITDGLDTGEAPALATELRWLRQHSRKLLWLNPLLRFEGYAPLATGAQVLHQHVHGMLAVHNLSKLEDLARAIASLLQTR